MIYDAKIEIDRKRAITKLEYLLLRKKVFEINEKRDQRSLSQNNYLHAILSYFALEYGEKADYVKEDIFKKLVNPDLFKYEYANRKTGEIRIGWKSSSDLDTKEMTVAIDRFRDYSSKEAGIYLPEPKEHVLLRDIQNQIENYKKFL